jgi:hypothetical protein
MVKYGLRPRTLKGELFALLSKAGSGGLKVSVLAKSSEVFNLLKLIFGNKSFVLITTDVLFVYLTQFIYNTYLIFLSFRLLILMSRAH